MKGSTTNPPAILTLCDHIIAISKLLEIMSNLNDK
jgi:hypothetical protein